MTADPTTTDDMLGRLTRFGETVECSYFDPARYDDSGDPALYRVAFKQRKGSRLVIGQDATFPGAVASCWDACIAKGYRP